MKSITPVASSAHVAYEWYSGYFDSDALMARVDASFLYDSLLPTSDSRKAMTMTDHCELTKPACYLCEKRTQISRYKTQFAEDFRNESDICSTYGDKEFNLTEPHVVI